MVFADERRLHSHNLLTKVEVARISCNAGYNAPCARTNAEWLAVTTAEEIRDLLLEGNTTEERAWAAITNGRYNMDQGFFPFVYDKQSGICVAHGEDNDFVGRTINEVFIDTGIKFSNATALLQRFIAASETPTGKWVKYLWKTAVNLYSNNNDQKDNKAIIQSKIAFVTNITDRFLIGVGYVNHPLPYDLPCSANYDSWCSLNNVQSLVGQAQSLLNQAESRSQFEAALYELSFNREAYFVDDGYYAFVMRYEGPMMAHALLHDYFGQTVGQIFVDLGVGTEEEGDAIHKQFVEAAEGRNGGWVQYPWRNRPQDELEPKVSYISKIEFQGENYYAASGFFMKTHISDSDTNCSDEYNLPCAFHAAQELSSHALSYILSSPYDTVEEIFHEISYNPTFKRNNIYVYVTDYNMTNVAHGGTPENVGMALPEIYAKYNISLDPLKLHDELIELTDKGHNWILYDWVVPGQEDSYFAKIAYVFGINIGGRKYYGGVGFNHKRAPVELYYETGTKMNGEPIPCTMEYCSNCSNANVNAILGQAVADLTLISSDAMVSNIGRENIDLQIEDVFKAITFADPRYRVNDFFVAVFSFGDHPICKKNDGSGCCLAHGSDVTMVGRTWQQILDRDEITSIKGATLHESLMRESGAIGGVYDYPYNGNEGEARTKHAVTSRFRENGVDYYVVSEYFRTKPPPTCDNCPDGTTCTSPDQAYCTKKSATPQTVTIVVPWVLAFSGLLLVSIGYGYWYKRRNWRKRQALTKKIKDMENQMSGMVEITKDSGVQITSAQEYKENYGVSTDGTLRSSHAEVVWGWEETDSLVARHRPSTMLSNTNFVRFPSEVSGLIEESYEQWREGVGKHELELDLSHKVQKMNNPRSGAGYILNFQTMMQTNTSTGYLRSLRREQRTIYFDSNVSDRLPPLPADINFFDQDGEDYLPTFEGQIIQVAKEHPDQNWLYGSVLYDPLLADAQNGSQVAATGLNRILSMALHDRPTSGWFPAVLSRPADVTAMQKVVELVDADFVSNLKAPRTWEANKEGRVNVPRGTREFDEVAYFFMSGLSSERGRISVVDVERIQTAPLWQSYAVKRETMKTRDAHRLDHLVNNTDVDAFERKWLFHGTTSENIPKIVKQGFNRAFAGRNAVLYGKGVYFARDASYSSSRAYSTPDAEDGNQRMFLCRVAVGDWCKGRNGQLTPDAKPYNQFELFDSTVDDEDDPSIFVVYHDAQAYPDYLVTFRRHD